jgi:hypothetical protein
MTARLVDQLFEFEQAMHYLEALHFHGFTVTIHSPKTSPNGLFCVTAYGHKGRRNLVYRGAHARLDKAIRQAGRKLSEGQLQEYAIHVADVGLGLLPVRRSSEPARVTS